MPKVFSGWELGSVVMSGAIMANHIGKVSVTPKVSAKICWTDEIAKAYGVAQPLLAAGDAVAARRAFIDRYEFEVSAARKVGAPVRAWFSWGWDEAARIGAVGRALELGMIRPEVAQKYAAQLPNGSDIAPKIAAMIGGTTKRLQ